jgi:uncharacterized protein YjbJ (UPF0337 family)
LKVNPPVDKTSLGKKEFDMSLNSGAGHEASNPNWDVLKGKWKQFKGKAKVRWGKLTDDHLDQIDGRREQLVGAIQEQYGKTRKEAENEADGFCKENCP